MSIAVKNLTKYFNRFQALKGVDLDVPSGELVALLGPSGSGKTTLLRIIAGLDFADEGSVLFDGIDVKNQAAKDRRVGFVFQHYALFKHMTVYENVAFGLKVKPLSQRPSPGEIRDRVYHLLKLVQLDWMATRFPSQLSGGQRQRIALARALAVEPKVLLLDEPFGSLDAKVRKELRQWLRRLHDEIHITSLFVTHDQEEALEVADRVVVMNEGQIIQIGSPEEIYHHPATPFVYHFLGNVNWFRCRVEEGKVYVGNIELNLSHPSQLDEKSSSVYIRPHGLDIHRQPTGQNCFEARVLHLNPAGYLVKVELISEWGDPVQVELPQPRFKELNIQKDDLVYVSPVGNTGKTKAPVYQIDGDPENRPRPSEKGGCTVWLTGLPGAGKSTVGYMLKKKLLETGKAVELIDGEVIRTNLSEGLGFTKEDRDVNIRRIGFVCQLLARYGVTVIVAAASPYRDARNHNRHMIPDFVEVYLKCPVEECEKRDDKGRYRRAREGRLKSFTGVDDPYEEPLRPELICETDRETAEESVLKIISYLKMHGY